MKRIGFIFDGIIAFENLRQSAIRASKQKKNRLSVAAFLFNYEAELLQLQKELIEGVYSPGRFHQFSIYDPKERQICVAPFRDRVLHQAICAVLEPILDKRYIFDSYVCRKGKGTHRALDRCQVFTRQYTYFLKCDVRKYYDTINHDVLKSLIRSIIKDHRAIKLLDRIIDHYQVLGKGLPIGNLTSQHFANLYLNGADHFIKETCKMRGYIRYMDDLVLFSDSKQTLHVSLFGLENYLKSERKLALKENKTIIAPVTQGIPFLGFRQFPNLRRVQNAKVKRFRKKIQQREKQFLRGDIDERTLVRSVNSLVGFVRHADSVQLRRRIFHESGIDV
jgi:RNA-directed DNA polymerase